MTGHSAAYQEFLRHMQAARRTTGTASALGAQVTRALPVDDLLRGALVQAVSALDRYVHEEVRARLLQHFVDGTSSSAMLRFQVPLSAVFRFRDEGGIAWLDEVIRTRHSVLSFQNPDKIADAVRLIRDEELWKAVALTLERPVQDVKQELKLIVARRNSIAHESDISPVPPYDQNGIEYEDVTQALNFVEGLVSAINAFLATQPRG